MFSVWYLLTDVSVAVATVFRVAVKRILIKLCYYFVGILVKVR